LIPVIGMSLFLVAPKPKRIQSPGTQYPGGEKKCDYSFADPSLEVQNIFLVSQEVEYNDYVGYVPLPREVPKINRLPVASEKPSLTEKTWKPSPPLRSQNPLGVMETPEIETLSTTEINVYVTTEPTPILFSDDNIRSPPNDGLTIDDDEDDEDHYAEDNLSEDESPSFHEQQLQQQQQQQSHTYLNVHNNENNDSIPVVPIYQEEEFNQNIIYHQNDDDIEYKIFVPPHVDIFEETLFDYQTKPVQATAPATPSYKRKRGDTQSRSLPDIRFPYYSQQSLSEDDDTQIIEPSSSESPPKRSTSSPSKYLYVSTDPPSTVTFLTNEARTTVIRRGPHRHHHHRSHSTHLTGLIENVNEIDGVLSSPSNHKSNPTKSEVISPTRYRHTFS